MITLALVCCAVVSVNGFLLSGFGRPPTTVKHLDPQKYLGKWYQTWSSASVADWFENGAKCVTADYSLGPNNTITVLNSEREKSPTGPLKNIHGFATLSKIPGQLTVTLETVPIPAPYWVLKLGPATFGPKKLYEFSIVSDNLRGTLFVLSRNATDFELKYEKQVLTFLKNDGFTTFYNKPVKTYQGNDCIYS